MRLTRRRKEACGGSHMLTVWLAAADWTSSQSDVAGRTRWPDLQPSADQISTICLSVRINHSQPGKLGSFPAHWSQALIGVGW